MRLGRTARWKRNQRQQLHDLFAALFGGVPAAKLSGSFNVNRLLESLGWNRDRFEDSLVRLNEQGYLSLRFTKDGQIHATCLRPEGPPDQKERVIA